MEEDSSSSAAARSIDAFFRNPAFIMESAKSPTANEAHYSGEMSPYQKDFSQNHLHHERHISAANITSLVDDPVFWHGYTSEEEAASPIGVDEMDWDETDDASFIDLPPLSPVEEKRAIIISQAHQLCTHAQAVTILSAGRPKMVTVPRMVDSPRSGVDAQFSSLPNNHSENIAPGHLRASSWDSPSNERSSSDRNSGDYSPKDSLDSSGRASPLSTAPSSIHDQPTPSHRLSVSSKHIPLMEAARLGSPYSPTSPSLNSSYTWSHPMAPTSAPSIPRSPMSHIKSGVLSALINKFDSSDSAARRNSKMSNNNNNNISRIGKQFLRKDTLEDVEDEYISKLAEPANDFTSPASPIIRLPMRNNSSTKPSSRMVARGANERAPVLTLPTCPDDFHNRSEWPQSSTQEHSARITTVA